MSTLCVTASGPSDAELVARAVQGDHGAFGELVERHRAAVYRAALAALGSPPEAEDAAQDAFMSAFRRLGGFRGDAAFKTWLLSIAWNHALNRRRTLKRWWKRLAPSADSAPQAGQPGPDRQKWTEATDVPSSGPSPEQAASDAQLRRDIAAEIRALSPKLRDALLLAQAGEYSYEEIAAMLGTAVGTIKWRVSEARRVIKKRLHERGYAAL
jgi:RNA polymerase sigma-70 factor, ECF subfamily